MPHVRSPHRLDIHRSALWIIDIQEKLFPVIPNASKIESKACRLVESARRLSVPTGATVQYPKGLGPLVPSLRKYISDPEEKVDFSAAVCRRDLNVWAKSGRDQVVIVGIETHICVLQTVLDLIAEGHRPFVVSDAVGSRGQQDHDDAMVRMRDCGATIVTSDSILFEWLSTAKHPEFKAISQLVKN